MVRNSWCASVRTELSNASAAWTYDSVRPLFRTELSCSAGSLECVSVIAAKRASARLAEHIRGQSLPPSQSSCVLEQERFSGFECKEPAFPVNCLNLGDERCLVKDWTDQVANTQPITKAERHESAFGAACHLMREFKSRAQRRMQDREDHL